jgi:hypothetical protein
MSNIYVGTRASFNEMIDLLDNRSVRRLNQGACKHLRKAANSVGIKQTEQGKRLEFYSVTQDEYDDYFEKSAQLIATLKSDGSVRPLIKMYESDLSKIFDTVNSKDKYKGGMDYKTASEYKEELVKEMCKKIERIGDDLNTRKKVDKVPENPYKVGDIIGSHTHPYGWYHNENVMVKKDDKWTVTKLPKDTLFGRHRVIKAGKKFIEVEALCCSRNPFFSNTVNAMNSFHSVVAQFFGMDKQEGKSYANDDWFNNQDPHAHFIEESANKDNPLWHRYFEWKPILSNVWGQEGKPQKFQWTKFADVDYKTGEYTSLVLDPNNPNHKVGYLYKYDGCYN